MSEMSPLGMGLLGVSALPALFGSGGKVSVPGAMARPTDPTSKFVDESGRLKDDFRLGNIATPDMDTSRGLLGGLKDQATAQGPSQSAQGLLAANKANQQAQQEQAQRQSIGSQATQAANLAMKGGLGTGSRERMGSQAATGLMRNQNQINQQGGLNALNIRAQDEARKTALQGSLADKYKGLGQFEFGRNASDKQGGMGLLQDKYKADMGAYAANQMAISQANAQNAASGGLLGGLF